MAKERPEGRLVHPMPHRPMGVTGGGTEHPAEARRGRSSRVLQQRKGGPKAALSVVLVSFYQDELHPVEPAGAAVVAGAVQPVVAATPVTSVYWVPFPPVP